MCERSGGGREVWESVDKIEVEQCGGERRGVCGEVEQSVGGEVE